LAPAAGAAVSQPSFTVALLSENGTGCPSGTTRVSALNSTEFTVNYDSYVAYAGDGAAPVDFRKNCQLDVQVGVPSGWTFGIVAADYRGYAGLDAGARGTLEASYYFSGMPIATQLAHPLSGPQDGEFEFTDQAPHVAWAPCHFSGTLNINTSISVYAGSSQSFLNEVSMGSSPVFHLGFEQC
jgi:hypothetical protein